MKHELHNYGILIQNLTKSLILALKKNATLTNTHADKNLSATNNFTLIFKSY